MTQVMGWMLAVLAASIYPLLYIAYRHSVGYKRKEVLDLIRRATRGTADQRPPEGRERIGVGYEQRAGEFFDLKYKSKAYALPLVLASTVTFLGALIGLVKAKFPLGLPGEFTQLLSAPPPTYLAGLAGAFSWGLADLIRKHRRLEFSPDALNRVWHSLLTAPLIAMLAASALRDELSQLAAYGVGAIPWRNLLDMVRDQAGQKLNLTARTTEAEPATLHRLQGTTHEIIERLKEEDITSAEHLAYSDPIQLLLTSNLGWARILDLMDQALLHGYLADKLPLARPFGIRGAIEVAELHALKSQGEPKQQETANAVLTELAKALAIPEPAFHNLMTVLSNDPQVTFLQRLWSDSFQEDVFDKGSPPNVQHLPTPALEPGQGTPEPQRRASNS